MGAPAKTSGGRDWGVEDTLGLWGAYFIGKYFLFFLGYLRFGFFSNLAFLIFLLVPMPVKFRGKRWAGMSRAILNALLALALLWMDSWLPPVAYAVEFFTKYELPSAGYMASFALSYCLQWEVAGVAALIAGYWWLGKRVHLLPVVVTGLVLVGFVSAGGKAKEPVQRHLDEFYAAQKEREVRFWKHPDTADFDVVLLHVCSLGWDDLVAAGLDRHPFLLDFDILFKDYNSVTSHSTPSALRLLRANCGQTPHGDIYKPVSEECSLYANLRRAGYQTFTGFAHDGTYGGMARFMREIGGAEGAILPDGLEPYQINFDGAKLYEPYAMLDKVWKMRQDSGAERAAIYLNLVIMHGGAHRVDDKSWWKTPRVDHYRFFFDKLAKDLGRFYELVESSGRKAVIVFVPEHGLGLRGSTIQANDLREIPLPYITIVPAGIKLVGVSTAAAPGAHHVVEKPVSHYGMSYVLRWLMKRPDFDSIPAALAEVVADIPSTPYVGENSEVVVVRKGDALYMKDKEGVWRPLPKDVEVSAPGAG